MCYIMKKRTLLLIFMSSFILSVVLFGCTANTQKPHNTTQQEALFENTKTPTTDIDNEIAKDESQEKVDEINCASVSEILSMYSELDGATAEAAAICLFDILINDSNQNVIELIADSQLSEREKNELAKMMGIELYYRCDGKKDAEDMILGIRSRTLSKDGTQIMEVIIMEYEQCINEERGT